MKKIILFLMLSSCYFLNAQSTVDINSPEFKNGTINFNSYPYITDVYADKFLGRWIWQNGQDSFEMILNPITISATDTTVGWIKYVKNGVVVEDGLQDRTVRTDRVNVVLVKGPSYISGSSVSGTTTSKYVLGFLMDDKVHDKMYKGTMTMPAGDTTRAVLRLADNRPEFRVFIDKPITPYDTTVYFPREMLMIKVQ